MFKRLETLTLIFSETQCATLARIRGSKGFCIALSDEGEIIPYTEFIRPGHKPSFDDAVAFATTSDIRMVYDDFGMPNDENLWEEWGFTPDD